MKALELIQQLQKLPPNAEVYIRPLSGMKLEIQALELRLPPTIALTKPGLGWADSISEAITGELVGTPLIDQVKDGRQ